MQYAQTLRDALGRKDGQLLAAVLSGPVDAAAARQSAAARGAAEGGGRVPAGARVPANWAPVGAAAMATAQAASAGDAVRAHEQRMQGYIKLIYAFKYEDAGGWASPAIWELTAEFRYGAMLADAATQARDLPRLKEAEKLIKDMWSASWNDRTPAHDRASKKRATLRLTSTLFKTYFTLNQLRLCTFLINPLQAADAKANGALLAKPGVFSQADLVTYKYYQGRINLYAEEYAKAEASLEYALAHTPRAAVANKRRVLRYLVPLKLYLGSAPSKALLAKYGLEAEYLGLSEAVQSGNLRAFDAAMEQQQDRLIQLGTYLLCEKLRPLVYRNLVKKMHLVKDKATRLSLAEVADALKWLGCPKDLDEVECVLANLIYTGRIKGYLSHQKRMLVVSGKNAFPSLRAA